jgi:16S rRNA (cytosine967-C5)-methyltransferase
VIAPARRAAYEALRRISDLSLDLPAALARSRDALEHPRDRALAGEIVIGTLRWRAALDAVIAAVTRRPLPRLDPEIVEILRLSAYQLWHLTRVPASAVVNDAVELTRVVRRGRASGLVNATLRTISRQSLTTWLPPRPSGRDPAPETALEYLSVTLSHPRWLVSRWLEREGFEATERWLQFNNAPAPLTLRTNVARTTTDALARDLGAGGVETTPARYARDALLVTAGNALATNAFQDGLFIVQDEASQLVATFAGARAGEHILDACASPGGKTVVMANDSRGAGRIVACDVRDRRVRLLRETLARTGVRAWLVQADLLSPLPFDPVFDCVLVDAPCSGLGTLRRDPDIKWRRQEHDLQPLAAAQQRLIADAADVVRPGGRLVYATCSSEPEENEAIVRGFLRSRPDFRQAITDEVRSLPGWPVVESVCLEQGVLRTRPPRHGLEAFFAVVLVKAEPL